MTSASHYVSKLYVSIEYSFLFPVEQNLTNTEVAHLLWLTVFTMNEISKSVEWVLNKAGVKRELLDTVKARKLAYYGHTMRKQRSCLGPWRKR